MRSIFGQFYSPCHLRYIWKWNNGFYESLQSNNSWCHRIPCVWWNSMVCLCKQFFVGFCTFSQMTSSVFVFPQCDLSIPTLKIEVFLLNFPYIWKSNYVPSFICLQEPGWHSWLAGECYSCHLCCCCHVPDFGLSPFIYSSSRFLFISFYILVELSSGWCNILN